MAPEDNKLSAEDIDAIVRANTLQTSIDNMVAKASKKDEEQKEEKSDERAE